MNSRFGLGFGALLIIATVTGCGATSQGAAANPPTATAAAQSSGVAAATTPGRPFGRGPLVAGTIQSINGSTVTVQGGSSSGTQTVQINDSTTIRKQVTETISDLKQGMDVIAVGQQNGSTFEARQIQVRAGQGQAPNGGGPGPGARNGNGGGASFVFGTIDSVAADSITVKSPNNASTQVQLASGGRIVEQQSGSTADLKTGEYILAVCQKQGDTLVATAVNLSDTPPLGGRATSG